MSTSKKKLISFWRDASGLTTIEWVTICAVVMIAALAISGFVLTSAGGLGGAVASQMDAAADDVK